MSSRVNGPSHILDALPIYLTVHRAKRARPIEPMDRSSKWFGHYPFSLLAQNSYYIYLFPIRLSHIINQGFPVMEKN